MSSNKRSIFETTCGRSGTHWLKYLISGSLDFSVELHNVGDFKKPYGRMYEYPKAIIKKEITDPGGYIYTYHIPINKLKDLSNYANIVVLVRDLRDVCVSHQYFLYYKNDIIKDDIENRLIKILKMGGPNPLFNDSYLNNYKNVNHYLIRYEDLINDTEKELFKLFKELNYSIDKDKIRKVINNNNFNKLSGGRKRGEENINHHYRKGIVGDWKNYLDDKMNDEFWERHGKIMTLWGYSK